MELEKNTLVAICTYVKVTCTSWMNVINSIWAFKIKRCPNGIICKLKARFCVRGDMQIKGVDVFDTFTPVVQWATVVNLLILSLQLNLAIAQVDDAIVFSQAILEE